MGAPLPTRYCGRLARLDRGGSPAEVSAQICRLESSEWRSCEWRTKTGGSTRTGGSVFTDGGASKSEPLPLGTYRLRLSAEGLETAETDVTILHQETTEIDLTLSPGL